MTSHDTIKMGRISNEKIPFNYAKGGVAMRKKPTLKGSNRLTSNARKAPDTRRVTGRMVDAGRYHPDQDLSLKQFVRKIETIREKVL
jgi:hypothetical protein